MKIVTTLLSVALIAGASTVAMAQSGGASGGASAGSDVNPEQMGRGADANPSGLNADPMAGNRANTMQTRPGQWTDRNGMDGMNSSNVSGEFTDGRTNSRGDRRGW